MKGSGGDMMAVWLAELSSFAVEEAGLRECWWGIQCPAWKKDAGASRGLVIFVQKALSGPLGGLTSRASQRCERCEKRLSRRRNK
jgi:hypothetical protein